MGSQKTKGEKPAEETKKGKEQSKESHGKEKAQEKRPTERRIKQVIRLADTNLDGEKPVERAIRDIKGVSFMFSNAVASVSGLGKKKLGELSEDEMKRLEDMITTPGRHNIPEWLYNRKLDPETGENRHLSVSALEFARRMDINEMKKMKTYKGIRHAAGLTVRGQRTRGSFRKGSSVGVKRERAKKLAGAEKQGRDKK